MAKTFVWLCLLILLSLVSAEQALFSSEPEYSGILRRFAINEPHTAETVLAVAWEHNLDIWNVDNNFIDIYFPLSSPDLPNTLTQVAHTTTMIENTKGDSPNLVLPWNLDSFENSTFHADYHPLQEVGDFIHEMAELHPNLTRTVQLGHSAEGREMYALEISRGYTHQKVNIQVDKKLDPNRRLGFLILGAQHAREWVGVATSMFLAHALVANSSSPHSLTELLDTFDFYIIPSPNPDGYSYTWSTDRLWYKNRQILGPSAGCVGLDMNRNWGYKWKPDAPSLKKKKPKNPTNECSHWFPGHRAFESPEVNNIANYMTKLPNLVGFINLRNYGQMLSTPYSYSATRVPKDSEDQIEAAMGAIHSLYNVHGVEFSTGRLSRTLYPAPGNILDYAYSKVGIKFAYTAHLRDTGTYGFSLPPSWIRPVGEETAELVRYLANFIKLNLKR